MRCGRESTGEPCFGALEMTGIRGVGDEERAMRDGRSWPTPRFVNPLGWSGVNASPAL